VKKVKTLVAYYSKTGNTKFVAQEIAKRLDAELCEIKDKKNRKGLWGFINGSLDARREKITEIEASQSAENYELVIAGSPVWFGKMAPATRTFLVQNDFSSRKVAFFLTSGSSDSEKALVNMKKSVDESFRLRKIEGLAVSKALEQREETIEQIEEWCKKLQTLL